jgi:hypothetical protein
MPSSPIPRHPIQKFTKAELDEADWCARALWHGISFEKVGKITSDAWLLDAFATPFYNIPLTNTYNGVTDLDVHELIKACKLYATFRDTNKQHYRSGLSVVASTIHPIYTNWLHKSGLSNDAYGALAVHKLSDALALRNPNSVKPNPHRTVIASRIMFFLAPTMPCFNMNNTIALNYGLQSRPYAYRDEYCRLMYDGLLANWNLLKTYSLPNCTHELTYETWQKINESDWWQRRVLDIAVLIKNGLTSAVVGLATIYNEHIRELQSKGLI